MKKIVILGSTGSIGTQSLEIISQSNRYEIFGLTCNTSVEKIVDQVKIYKPKYVAIHDESLYKSLKEKLDGIDVKILSGMNGLIEIASHEDVDIVITAVVGNIGLKPTIAAIGSGKTIALANKETLVTSGHLIMPLAKEKGVNILPVDSEHSAIFQCLNGEPTASINRILLTASGGAFRSHTKEAIRNMIAKEALKHPNWQMGSKITVDSATLMNKGLEFIEAKWLFDRSVDDIEVLIHPQSIIHSMVEFVDGSVIAQMGVPDMKIPIIYALDYPKRFSNTVPKVDWFNLSALTFEKPDHNRFPCLNLAISAIKQGGIMPTILNAANEVLVEAYLRDEIGFYDISQGVEWAMGSHKFIQDPDLDTVLMADEECRQIMKDKYRIK